MTKFYYVYKRNCKVNIFNELHNSLSCLNLLLIQISVIVTKFNYVAINVIYAMLVETYIF